MRVDAPLDIDYFLNKDDPFEEDILPGSARPP